MEKQNVRSLGFKFLTPIKAMKQWLQRTPGLTRPIKKVFFIWVDNKQ